MYLNRHFVSIEYFHSYFVISPKKNRNQMIFNEHKLYANTCFHLYRIIYFFSSNFAT